MDQVNENIELSKIKPINIISQTELSEIWRSIDAESNEKFIQVILKSKISSELQIKLEHASKIKYCSLIPIASFNLFLKDSNDNENPSIYYNDLDGKTISELLQSKEEKSKINSLQRFYIVNGLISALLFFQLEDLDPGPLTVNDIFIVNGKPKIINYAYNQQINYNPFQSIANIIKLVCIDSFDENITISKENYSELCFYKDLYNILSNSSLNKQPKSQNILKGILNADLQSLNLAKFTKEVDEYQSEILTSSLKSRFLIQISQQNRKNESIISEIDRSASKMSEIIKSMRNLISSIHKNNNEEKMKQIKTNMTKIQSDIDKTTNQFNFLTMYSNFSEDSKSSTQNSNKTKNTYISLNPNSSGIFNYLVNSQETVFDHLVVPSQSSGDVYCIIDQSNPQNYSSGSGDYEWIQFEFAEEIEFTSFKIQSAHRAFLKTWDIIGYDSNDKEVILYKTKNNSSLNGKYNELRADFKTTIKTQKLRLEKFGANWSNTNFMRIYKIEFYTNDPEFQGKGVFEKLLEDAPDHNPHKAKVYLTSSNFDFRYFHTINPKRSICTLYDEDSPWFQVELPFGAANLTGYRMIQLPRFPISSWNFECSNDGIHWDLIHQGKISNDIESNIIIVRCVSNKAYSFFRIVNTMSNDNDDGENVKLRMRHFDIFGLYQPIQNQCDKQKMNLFLNIDSKVKNSNNLYFNHYSIVASSSDENFTKYNEDGTPIIDNREKFVDPDSPRYYDYRKVETDLESDEEEEEEEIEEEEEEEEEIEEEEEEDIPI